MFSYISKSQVAHKIGGLRRNMSMYQVLMEQEVVVGICFDVADFLTQYTVKSTLIKTL